MNIPNNIEVEYVNCPLGHHIQDEVIINGSDLIYEMPGDFTVVQCPACKLMRTNPRPTKNTIGYYYPDNYGPYLGTQVRQQSISGIKKLVQTILRSITNSNATKLPPLAIGRMLEIGCASGAFMHEMAGQGWQVHGIEFAEKAAQSTAQLGYQVYIGSLESAPPPINNLIS